MEKITQYRSAHLWFLMFAADEKVQSGPMRIRTSDLPLARVLYQLSYLRYCRKDNPPCPTRC